MTYLMIGLCLLAAVISSWQLSATPFRAPPETPEEDAPAVTASAQDLILAGLTAQAAPSPPLPVPAPASAPGAPELRV